MTTTRIIPTAAPVARVRALAQRATNVAAAILFLTAHPTAHLIAPELRTTDATVTQASAITTLATPSRHTFIEKAAHASASDAAATGTGTSIAACPCSLWDASSTPAVPDAADGSGVELGVSFHSDVDGFVRAIRFYKGANNLGPHTGHLWTDTGTLLSTVTFSSETATGWQQATLPSPVHITAGTNYIASYHAPAGEYSYTSGFFSSSFPDAGPLHAAAARNGVFRYGPDGTFPDQSYNATNYWVDVVLDTTTTTDPRSTTGEWAGPFAWPVVAVHAAVVKTGEVLVWDGYPVDGGLSARLWNPATGAFVEVPNNRTNLFCSGHAQLPDGRLLVVGGHVDMPGMLGSAMANIFDPATRTWTAAPDMNYQRWYPTATTLPDGRVLVTSGGQTCEACVAPIPEVYDPATNTFTLLSDAPLSQPLYPYMFVLPDGRLLNAGSDEDPFETRTLDVATQTWTMLDQNIVDGGSAVMYSPGKVLKSGSVYLERPDQPATNTAYVFDATVAGAAWRPTASMQFSRAHHNLVALPDGTVVAIGGGTNLNGNDASLGVHEAEIWSPVTEQWTTMAAMQVSRLYHSTALLLPDGRVLSAGSGRDFGTAPNQLSAEVFSPPYLFKGARPSIASAPTAITYNSAFTIATADAASIASVSFIRLGSVTHAYDEDQRFQTLTFARGTSSLTVNAPANANLAPPGYYMLFLVNSTGVPSVAAIMGISGTSGTVTPPPTSTPPPGATSFIDTTVSDFKAGTVAPEVTVTQSGDGEVVLAPAESLEFDGSSLPLGWTATAWSTNGSATVANGQLALAAARVTSPASAGPSRAIEFSATFGDSAYEHVGFGVTLSAAPWAVFGTASGGALYARTNNGTTPIDTVIPGSWLGSPHRYRIEWLTTSVSFWVDGTLVATHNTSIAGPMRPIASAYLSSTPPLTVDWMRVGPYAAAGSFTSRVFAAPAAAPWTIAWNANAPAGTSVSVSVRAGNTPVPDGTWSTFAPLASSPATTPTSMQYVQYRADLSTSDPDLSPELRDVTLTPASTTSPTPSPMPQVSVSDVTSTDFAGGTTDAGTSISNIVDGEVTLSSRVRADFDGSMLPADWGTAQWDPSGTVTVSNGAVDANGSRAFGSSLLSGPATLEFAATFADAPYQHVGFGITFNETPWAIFSTGSGGGLYARTANGSTTLDTPISGSWLGSPHMYRIEWSASAVSFFIDGVLAAQHTIAIGGTMRPIVSDYTAGGAGVSVDWLRVGPYATSGSFVSRVMDGGAPTAWNAVAWTADAPAGTSLVVSVRAGNSPIPDGTWTAFAPVAASGGSPAVAGRYVQYRVDLATSSADSTPVLKDVTLTGTRTP